MTILPLIELVLAKDTVFNDLIAIATLPADLQGLACITAKASGVLSGADIADQVFTAVDKVIVCNWQVADADRVVSLPIHVKSRPASDCWKNRQLSMVMASTIAWICKAEC